LVVRSVATSVILFTRLAETMAIPATEIIIAIVSSDFFSNTNRLYNSKRDVSPLPKQLDIVTAIMIHKPGRAQKQMVLLQLL